MSAVIVMISDGQARRIASEWHGGMPSALYSLASSGAIDLDRVRDEISANCSRWTNTYERPARVPRNRDGPACGTTRR
jgi:hypothetical protein